MSKARSLTLPAFNSFELKAWHFIVVFVLLQLAIAFLTVGMTFVSEEAMWHYIGRNWVRHGLVPYAGGVDNKSPLIFFIFGISDWLFGVNIWFPRLLGIAVQSVGIYYVFKITRLFAGSRAGFFAISLYGLSLLWKTAGGKLVSFTETYAVCLIILSFYFLLSGGVHKRYFISGLFASLAVGFRISACFGSAAILISSMRRGGVAVVLFLFGFFAGIVLLLTFFLSAGIHINDIYVYAFADNFGPGSTTDHDTSQRMEFFANAFFYGEIILFYAPAVAYFLIRKRIDPIVLWLIFEFIGIVALGIYARPHFKSILPPFAIASAISINYLVEQYKVPAKALLLIVWIVFFPKNWEPIYSLKALVKKSSDSSLRYCEHPSEQPDEYSEQKLGVWLKKNSNNKETILVAGSGARVQVFSERLSPTIFFNATQTRRAKDRFYEDLHSTTPNFVVIPAFNNYKIFISKDLRNFIDSLVKTRYNFQQCMYGYDIYRKK